MKTIIKILLNLTLLVIALGTFPQTVWAVSDLDEFTPTTATQDRTLLEGFQWPEDKTFVTEWGEGITDTILKVAKDLKNLVFALATMVFLVLVFRIFFASNTEEESQNLKKGITWIVLWIVLMQISYTAVAILFDKDVNEALWESLIEWLFLPLVNLLLLWASFAFLLMGIVAFYLLVTANGDDEKAKKWKQTVFYAVIGFVVIKFADIIVNASYSGVYNPTGAATTDLIDLMSRIINWVSTFVWLVVVLMIMYAGSQLIFWFWDEEKFKKAKKSLLYIFIGLLILVMNYLIVTFFIVPEGTI